jgi:hypothetical protein
MRGEGALLLGRVPGRWAAGLQALSRLLFRRCLRSRRRIRVEMVGGDAFGGRANIGGAASRAEL